MKHFFMEIDGMTITYGDLRKEILCDSVPYYIERDGADGDFDFAAGSLPTCTPIRSKGFSEAELWDIESLMRDNMLIIYDQIRGVGAWGMTQCTSSSLIDEIEEAACEANASDEVWRQTMITLEEKRESEKKAARQLGFEEACAINDAKKERFKKVAAALVSVGRGEEFAKAFSDEKRLNELASELGID